MLEDAKKLLALPDNDYAWSSWGDSKTALAEIDDIITTIKNDQRIDLLTLKVIFAPTGPMQEVSLSSGWADAFLKLEDRFDKVVG